MYQEEESHQGTAVEVTGSSLRRTGKTRNVCLQFLWREKKTVLLLKRESLLVHAISKKRFIF